MIVQSQDFISPQPLPLRCGRSLPGFTLRYETLGRLNEAADNAILLCHALSGSAHVAGRHHASDRKPGWWDILVGPGKAFDTDRFFIVCSNVLGSCYGSTGPTSVNPATGLPWQADFPAIHVADMVAAQARLADHLGIRFWHCIAGGSLGGMQALQWAIDFPDRIRSCLAIATTPALSAQALGFNWIARRAILTDPAWQEGFYAPGPGPAAGLATARMIGHMTYLSEISMERKFHRQLQDRSTYGHDFAVNFQVESYLEHQGREFLGRFDANSYLHITRATDSFDLAADGGGSLRDALARSSCRFALISFSTDWIFPPHQLDAIAQELQALGRPCPHHIISSDFGHDAFLLDDQTQAAIIRDFLG